MVHRGRTRAWCRQEQRGCKDFQDWAEQLHAYLDGPASCAPSRVQLGLRRGLGYFDHDIDWWVWPGFPSWVGSPARAVSNTWNVKKLALRVLDSCMGCDLRQNRHFVLQCTVPQPQVCIYQLDQCRDQNTTTCSNEHWEDFHSVSTGRVSHYVAFQPATHLGWVAGLPVVLAVICEVLG